MLSYLLLWVIVVAKGFLSYPLMMKKTSPIQFTHFFYIGLALLLMGCGIESASKDKKNDPTTYSLAIDSLGLELPLADPVVLSIDAVEQITLTEDGIIEFASDYESGQNYTVSIASSAIMQNCELENESGTFTNDHIVVFLTCTDKAWTHPLSINDKISLSGGHASAPEIAMDDAGNAIVVWQQYNGNHEQIFKSEFRDGVWKHPADLNDNISPNGANAFFPQVAMDNNGNAIITWRQFNGTHDQIFISQYRNGAWTLPTDLNDNISPDDENAKFSQVAMDDNGNAIITWYQNNGSHDQIFISQYRNGVWNHPSELNQHISVAGQNAVFPQVAMDDNSNALIVWQQYDGNNEQIFKSEYRNNEWLHPLDLNDHISIAGEPCDNNPQLAMNNHGAAIITWAQNNGSGSVQIFKSEYRSGSWMRPESLNDHISPNTQSANDPQVAMDDNDNALITWAQSDASHDQIFLSEYRNSAWSHPEDLNDHISVAGQDAIEPQVGMDNIGNAIITWLQNNGSVIQAYKSEYRKGTWIHPTDLTEAFSLNGTQRANHVSMAMNNLGDALIAWWQYDGSNDDQIFLSEFR